jgi:hypothetical protein
LIQLTFRDPEAVPSCNWANTKVYIQRNFGPNTQFPVKAGLIHSSHYLKHTLISIFGGAKSYTQ